MTDEAAFVERSRLRGAAYADDAKLSARQAIYAFIERPWPAANGRVLGAIDLDGDEVVADVGCGNGHDVRDLRRAGFGGTVLGFDLSVGMLSTLSSLGVPLVNADAAELPLRDGAADVVLAMHMLYHCPDIAATAAEIRRVLRPDGVFLASTNSVDHLRELRELWTAALSDVLGHGIDPWRNASSRFSLEEGGQFLATAFADVTVHRAGNRLLVPSADPVVAYVDSTRDLSGQGIDDEIWTRSIDVLRHRVAAHIRDEGALEVTVVNGLFVCR